MNIIVFRTLPLLGSHTGANLTDWVRDLVLDFGVESKKVMALIDFAAGTLEAKLGWHSLGCAGHTLQLCVNAGLKD